jgi:hypothetical protein
MLPPNSAPKNALRRAPLWLFAAALFAVPQTVFAWGTATHVYIAKKLDQQFGVANTQEMYGATLPDFPTLMFGDANAPFLYSQTHIEFMKMVKLAPLGYQRAFAYGFASHNELWGADLTAHQQSLTTGPGGYVTQKVPAVAAVLSPLVAAFLQGKVPDPGGMASELAPMLADTCIESAVDLLVSENEFEGAGVEMMLASGLRGSFVPGLLASAYSKALAAEAGITQAQAAAILVAAEAKNRQYLVTYGAMLTQPNRWDLLAETIAQLAGEMLAAPPYNLPSVAVPPDLVKAGLDTARSVVLPDYSAEVAATVKHVGTQLLKHWIFTSLIP